MVDSLKIQKKIPGKIDDAMLQRAGKEVAQMYRERGKKWRKCTASGTGNRRLSALR